MASYPEGPGADPDGVRVVAASPVRRAARLLGLAVGLVVLATVGTIVAIRLAPGRRPPDVARVNSPRPRQLPASPLATPTPLPAAGGGSVVVRRAEPMERAPQRAAAPAATAVGDATAATADQEAPHEDPPFSLGEPGTGIQAFPPPGTKPIKRGIIVPDDYELPPGYVRHYQTTDDGQQLPPILMFSPDYTFVDANGKPVAVPPDRIVPPAMAPPGLPVRLLDVPAPTGAASPAH
jgi:hypothetical protein